MKTKKQIAEDKWVCECASRSPLLFGSAILVLCLMRARILRARRHEQYAKHYAANKDRILKSQVAYRARPEIKALRQVWSKRHQQKWNETRRLKHNMRTWDEYVAAVSIPKPIKKTIYRIRTEIYRATHNGVKNRPFRFLGCTASVFRHHIESQFRDGMSWDNYGNFWEVDHIKPIIEWDLSVTANALLAGNYTNTQPLLMKEHRRKSVSETRKWLNKYREETAKLRSQPALLI